MHTTKDIKKELRLITYLKPYIDAEGILRIYGRLDKSNFHFQVQHQVRHSYTEPVISDIHQKKQYSGPVNTLVASRETYWINGSISTIKHYL